MGLEAAIYADGDHTQKLKSLRIGNATMVCHLARCLREVEPDSPTLLGKVLYSGTHGGDELSLEDIKMALKEIRQVRAATVADEYLQAFLQNFKDLLQMALDRGLPVVF
jgi:hypothetical protein